ncbi:MAG: tRNA pseudouridine(13) synthase TruD, partial [Legionellaceae bacterium]
PTASGLFKASTEDFKVDEVLGFELSGVGEHQFLRIEKRGLTTEELMKAISKCIEKPMKLISHAGLKDRQAVTTQWISIHCPGEAIKDIASLQGDRWRVIESKRHSKKLKIGGLQGNRFTLVIRNISSKDAMHERLLLIQKEGVPNYFGPQRFGHQGQNMTRAEDVLLKGARVKDRFLRGIYYSAARSYLFNRILSARVEQGTWNKALSGDVMQLAGTHSIFTIDTPDELILERITNHDVSPASVLWGKGESMVHSDALKVQEAALTDLEPWCKALVSHDLVRAYRAHVLYPEDLTWDWVDDVLTLTFSLTAGGYATSVLREMMLNADA